MLNVDHCIGLAPLESAEMQKLWFHFQLGVIVGLAYLSTYYPFHIVCVLEVYRVTNLFYFLSWNMRLKQYETSYFINMSQ